MKNRKLVNMIACAAFFCTSISFACKGTRATTLACGGPGIYVEVDGFTCLRTVTNQFNMECYTLAQGSGASTCNVTPDTIQVDVITTCPDGVIPPATYQDTCNYNKAIGGTMVCHVGA